MSGGVDSAVAAGLLAEAGESVVGATLRLFCSSSAGARATACCSEEAIRRAADACSVLGIPHVVLDEKAAFRRAVMDPFADAYIRGETPIPCAACNADLKFGALFERAAALGASTIATGHYAELTGDGTGGCHLTRAADRAKDQTYFLWGIARARLPHVRFPIGALTKTEVRERARAWGLPMAEAVESQDICFVDGRDYAEVVGEMMEERAETAGLAPGAFAPRPGAITDRAGRTLGTHRGLIHYTVGQRKGLGLTSREPLYVLALDAGANSVIVGPAAELLGGRCAVRGVNWLVDAPASGESRRFAVQIRYLHAPAAATVTMRADGSAEIAFEEQQRALSPGQSAVFYDGKVLAGGGVIDRVPLTADTG